MTIVRAFVFNLRNHGLRVAVEMLWFGLSRPFRREAHLPKD
jgi:hypothetical protein